jgi:hypothetical protein
MRRTTPPLPFDLSPEITQDPWLPWLVEHAHPDLWMPRVPIAVVERIQRRYKGQKKNTLITLWIGIRRLLVLYARAGRSEFSVRDIAAISGVSRSRLCGDNGFIQDLLDVGVIGVTVHAGPEVPGVQGGAARFQGRTRYAIDMAALEAESLVLLRRMFRDRESVPRRGTDGSQRSMLDLLSHAHDGASDNSGPGKPTLAPEETRHLTAAPVATAVLSSPDGNHPCTGHRLVPDGTTVNNGILGTPVSQETSPAPDEARLCSEDTAVATMETDVVSHGTTDPSIRGTSEADTAPLPARMVSHVAVGMGGLGMQGMGGGGIERSLSQQETIELVHSAIQQALGPAIDRVLATVAQRAGAASPAVKPEASIIDSIPEAPTGEPRLTIGPREAWELYKGTPDPLDLHRLSLLPHRFDVASGGHGAYWLTRAILMLSERPGSVTPPYLRGVLERMQRAGDWSTAQLEAPPEEGEASHAAPPRERARTPAPGAPPTGATPPTPPALPQARTKPGGDAPAAPPAPPGQHPTLATFYRYAPPGTRLIPDQERQLVERVRDQDIWDAVCANWRADGHKFSNSANVLDRYCTLEAQCAAEQSGAADGLSKLEREIHALPGLDDEEKAVHCATMMGFLVEDRRRYVEDLRRQLALSLEGVC